MSLLEDIFLQDEADEAQELERVIDGDEFDERPRSRSATPDSDANSHKDDEAEEDKRRVDPTSAKAKRVIKNPRFILNPARLTGPRGIQVIPDHFKDFRFKGKGHEKEDVDMILKKLEHWAYRLYPKFQFEDCLKKIETLGKKRPVMVHLQKIRTDQFMSEDTVVQKDSSDDETPVAEPQEEDEFDKLLQQQIELARATPAPDSVKKVMATPKHDRSPFTMPKATSSPSISDEQKERMIRNRRLAEERRLARLKPTSIDTTEKKDDSNNISQIIEVDEENFESNVTAKKINRSNIIDSSDEECDVTSVNQAVVVDVHDRTNIEEAIDKNTDKDTIVLEDEENNLDDIEMVQQSDKDNVEINQDVPVITEHLDKNAAETAESDKILETNFDKVSSEVVEENCLSIDGQDNGITLTADSNNVGEAEIDVIHNKTNDVQVITDENQSNTPNHESIQRDSSDNQPEIITEPMTTEHSDEQNVTSKNNTKIAGLEQDNSKTDELLEDIMDVDFSDDF